MHISINGGRILKNLSDTVRVITVKTCGLNIVFLSMIPVSVRKLKFLLAYIFRSMNAS